MYGFGALGFVIALLSVLQWYTATGTNATMFKLSAGFGIFLLLVQCVAAFWLVIYNYSLEKVAGAPQDGGSKWDELFFGAIIKPVESYLCESYRNCCEDPVLSEADDYVCVTSHEGTTSSLPADRNDPSRAAFCEIVSGVESVSLGAARGLGEAGCDALEGVVQGFDWDSRHADFCTSGVGGYEGFLALVLGEFRSNFNVIGAGFFVLIMVQMEQVRVLRVLYVTHKAKEQEEAGLHRKMSGGRENCML